MTPDVTAFATFALVAFSTGGVLLALFLPKLSGGAQTQNRRDLALGLRGAMPQSDAGKAAATQRQGRRSVEQSMRDIDANGRPRSRWQTRTSLARRLREAGLALSPIGYAGICLGITLGTLLLLWLGLQASIWASAGIAIVLGLWLPHTYVARNIKKRGQSFTAAFPDAVDIIVRGVRSGIPLTDCFGIVSTEAQMPVSQEFRIVVEDLAMGLAVEDAVQRLSERVPLEEARFFSIVITIQSRTGGNLSEALGNLSIVLRDRAKMRGKIRAMSSEAKASAAIIGSLPPMVCFLVFLTSPDYVGLLFSTLTGNIVLAACGFWMMCGVAIMRQMINFDF